MFASGDEILREAIMAKVTIEHPVHHAEMLTLEGDCCRLRLGLGRKVTFQVRITTVTSHACLDRARPDPIARNNPESDTPSFFVTNPRSEFVYFL
jgi:hypothetical protein